MEFAEPWTETFRSALTRYDEALLRAVAGRLFKPRSFWPVDELIERSVEAVGNPPVIDRRLKELSPASRALLAAIGLSGQSVWPSDNAVLLLSALGYNEGLAPILTILDSGLAVPVLPANTPPLRSWEDWLGTSPPTGILQFAALPAHRAAREGPGLPTLPGKRFDAKAIRAGDGLEWPIRLGVLWQRLHGDSIRLTQSNALFKRDLTRLQSDPLLAGPDVQAPDSGVLALELGRGAGLFTTDGGELKPGALPPAWEAGLVPAIRGLWAGLTEVTHWDPVQGYDGAGGQAVFPTVALPAMLLLAGQAEGTWTHANDIAEFLLSRHPVWGARLAGDPEAAEDWIEAMALEWAVPMRLVEAAQDGEGWWFRLSPIGRHVLAQTPAPDLGPGFPQCLVIQPNGDIIAYRQGLTPGLVAKLTRFAEWKMLGPACTLGLTAESVYRGLETGLTIADITGVLQQHSAHAVPSNVLDLVRRWAGKRERISIHRSATLLEFNSPADLEAAVARGLVSRPVTDRIGLAEGEIDYRQLRLIGNRDYEAKPQQCVNFENDGVTFTVDMAASDLLLEAELARLSERLDDGGTDRRFRITPESARRAREQGLTLADLEQWFSNRAGHPLSSSARLLFAPPSLAGTVRPRMVITLPSEAATDGVCQWPATADLIEDRLGPYSVAVAEGDVATLLERLQAIGVGVHPPT